MRLVHNVTYSCNYKCWHCYNNSRPKSLDNTRNLQDVAKQLCDFEFESVSLSGGEPLLVPEIFEIAGIYRAAGMPIALISNGSLITQNNIGKIEKAFDHIQISIDNWIDPEYGRIEKGNPSFGKYLRRCVSLLSKSSIPATYTFVPNRLNISITEYFEELYFDGLKGLVVQEAVSAGRATQRQDMFLSEEDRTMLADSLRKIARDYSLPVQYIRRKRPSNSTITVDPAGTLWLDSFAPVRICDSVECGLVEDKILRRRLK